MTGAVECRYYGRDFTAEEMALLRALIAGPPALNRHRLSKAFCRRIGWFKPDGGLKDMMARVTMLDMHRDGLIVLPPKQGRQNRPKPIVFGPDTEPPLFPTPTTLDEVRPLTLRPVVRGTREGKLWNEFIARYHYLGYKTLVGAQMRYAVHDRNGWPVALLGFSTAAWKLTPRDNFIGWTSEKREKNLHLVVDNPRFLILPWIEIPNLGSHILALVRQRLPEDWTERYNTTPLLIETFVETPRYTGAVYRASGWIRVGTTQGRGRYDTHTKRAQPKKDIWLRPLRKDWQRFDVLAGELRHHVLRKRPRSGHRVDKACIHGLVSIGRGRPSETRPERLKRCWPCSRSAARRFRLRRNGRWITCGRWKGMAFTGLAKTVMQNGIQIGWFGCSTRW